MYDAIAIADSVVVDELDCKKSLARQPTTKTVDQIIKMCSESHQTMWIFIERHFPKTHFEIGCSTLGFDPEYFLWIRVSEDNANKLVQKYNLRLQQLI